MASILTVPNEILVKIAGHLGSLGKINNFARTNHHCYAVLNRHLYVTASNGVNLYDSGLIWVVERRRVESLKHFIDVGALAGPDCVWQLETLLKLSAPLGDMDTVKTLFDYGVTLFADFHLECEKVLGAAIKGGQLEVIEFLLSNGVKLDGLSRDGNLLIDAIQGNSAEIIAVLASHGADFTQLDPQKSTALHIAIKSGKSNAAKGLLQLGLDPNAIDNDGNAPIHYLGAYENRSGRYSRGKSALGNTDPVSLYLLNYGADPYLKDQYGLMPLWIASYTDAYSEAAALLKHGVDPNGLDCEGNSSSPISLEDFERAMHLNDRLRSRHNDQNGERNSCTPLCVAAYYGDGPTIHELLKHGANPNLPDNNGDLPLHLAVLSKRSWIVELLVEGGSSLNDKDGHGKSALGWAVKLGGLDVVDTLLKCGASVDSASLDGVDPIFRALEYGHSTFHGTNSSLLPPHIVGPADGKGMGYYRHTWPYWCTCCLDQGEPHECERALKSFLEHGSKLDSRDKLGRTILHQVAYQLCPGGVKFLLKQGADPMAKDSFGQIPLHMACHQPTDDPVTFEELIEAGSDPNSRDINGDTPLHLAARDGCPDTICYLRRYTQANFLARNNRGNTPLHEAVDLEIGITCEETIHEMRRAKNDFNMRNNDGHTVWDVAQKYPEDTHFDYVNRALSCELEEEDTESESDNGSENDSDDESAIESEDNSDEAIEFRMEAEFLRHSAILNLVDRHLQ